MKVTPALKKELAQWLDSYWTTYLKGDIETWATFIRDDYRNIGGTKEEIWNSKQEIIDYTYSILDQMLGTVEIRNREIEVIPYGEYMMVNEFTDIYVKIEGEWTFYGPFRMSSLLEKTDTSWIALYQHGSYPDMKAMEGEAFSVDAVKAENAKLQEAVKSRTLQLEIEAALERVRAVAMGMKKPEDMLDVCRVISDQLQQFGVEKIRNVQTAIIDENIGQYLCYQYFPAYDQTTIEATEYRKSPVEHEMVKRMLASKDGHFIGSLSGNDLDNFRAHRKEENHFPDPILDEVSELSYCFLSIGEGSLGLSLYEKLTDDVNVIFKRFHKVFSLAYQRFRDIQKAEAQAKEALIEAALEKVRNRSLAMHTPNELGEVVAVIVEKLTDLGVVLDANGVVLCTYFADSKDVLHWIVSPDFKMAGSYLLPYFDHPIFREAWESKKSGDAYFSKAYSVEDKNSFFEYAFEHSDYRFFPDDFKQWVFQNDKHILSFAWQKNSAILIPSHTGVVPSSEEVAILKRFARVFEQAYVRFLDLQKAEAQAREARIELSRERIRAQVTAMQESSDLLDIVVTMRSEFVNLGHEAHYFWHMRWLPNRYEKAMTSGDGTRIGMVMTLPRHIHGDIQQVANWEKGKEPSHILAMDVETAVDYVQKMITLGDFEQVDPQAPTLDDIRHIDGLTFVMARTTHGEIGFSLPGEVPNPPKDAVNTLVRFAGVFDLAYKRFEDLKAAEKDLVEIKAARHKAEEALAKLKATQSQLIQQEKLASLGQLTAGIAHEIKNPLNFVNNFSEVSIELIEEALVERTKITGARDENLVNEILMDIKSNLQKVHEHGTRANGIVSSMLQHSRGGSGKMEPTDLNALIKEYVNLCFHGMRAGTNPINVDIQLNLDERTGFINLISEDFSRVVLNLVNNAFDAMREKTKTDPDYRPVLSIQTRSKDKVVEISIGDNGPGIPPEIKDKILQPFFTTKKGTEGTGLGLSISHDIVKAHGGQLEIESLPGESTTFIIHLEKKA